MKRKIINGLLALALLLPVTVGFTSCKDTDEDQFNNLKKEQYDLEKKVQELNLALESLKALQAGCQEACKQTMQTLLNSYVTREDFDAFKDNDFKTLLQNYAKLEGSVSTIQTSIATINSTLTGINNKLATQEAKNAQVDLAISKINTDMAELQKTISGLKSDISGLQTSVSDLSGKVSGLEGDVSGLKTKLETLETNISTLTTNLTTLTGTVTTLQNQVTPIIQSWDTVKQQAYDAYTWVQTNKSVFNTMNTTLNTLTTQKIPGMEKDIKDVQTKTDSIAEQLDFLASNMRDIDGQINGKGGILDWLRINEDKIDSLRKDVDKLFNKVNYVTNRLDSLVTGIILQGTVNPVFGTMALPVNIQSNVLMAYWGENNYGKAYKFPTGRTGMEFDNSEVLSDEDMDMLEVVSKVKEYYTVNEGNLVDDAQGNAGRVYVTVNPNNIDFTGVTLPIVNSRDEESGIKLTNLRKSDAELTFGYGRSDVKNGFYEADATLNVEDISKVMVCVDDELMASMKEFLHERTKKDLVEMMKRVYDQFNGILPANGLKASWTVNNEKFAVYSQYNLAAAAFKPLSFRFLHGVSLRDLPIITPISDQQFDLDRFKVTIKMPEFTINTSGVTFTPSISFADITYTGTIKVVIKDYPVIENNVVIGTKEETFEAEGVQELLNQINTTMQQSAEQMNGEIESQFRSAIDNFAKEIQAQVDEMMKKVQSQINGQISDLVDDIAKEINDRVGSYIGKANKLINKYNSAANRINDYIKNANAYLQVTMLSQGADGLFHHLSNSKAFPTPFVLDGGDAITLYLTTYTAEIAVPCLKKFVGVTNVFKGDASAQGGDADCLAALKAANATDFMNTALPGYQRRVAFAGKQGYVYELVYQGLDYHGYTSTRKFYIEVK